jgi:glycine/D-amino acid oxidase-like deaminating enzyme
VTFRFNVSVKRLEAARGAIERAVIDDEKGIEESLRAEAYVTALGSYSPLLLAPIGVSVPVYPVKGYSITLPLEPGDEAPKTSLTDHARKIVFSRLGERSEVRGARQALLRMVPECRARGAGEILDRLTTGHTQQSSAHRTLEVLQPLSQHRARNARLDACLRVGPGTCRHRERPKAGARVRLPRVGG